MKLKGTNEWVLGDNLIAPVNKKMTNKVFLEYHLGIIFAKLFSWYMIFLKKFLGLIIVILLYLLFTGATK